MESRRISDANYITARYMDSILLRERLIDSVVADAAAVGRSMLPSLEKDGTEGVKAFLGGVQNELRFVMSCTGFAHVSEIDDSCLCLPQRAFSAL